MIDEVLSSTLSELHQGARPRAACPGILAVCVIIHLLVWKCTLFADMGTPCRQRRGEESGVDCAEMSSSSLTAFAFHRTTTNAQCRPAQRLSAASRVWPKRTPPETAV
jgi:hypothetical protein